MLLLTSLENTNVLIKYNIVINRTAKTTDIFTFIQIKAFKNRIIINIYPITFLLVFVLIQHKNRENYVSTCNVTNMRSLSVLEMSV